MAKFMVIATDPDARIPYGKQVISGRKPVEVSNDKEARHLIKQGLIKPTAADVHTQSASDGGSKK